MMKFLFCSFLFCMCISACKKEPMTSGMESTHLTIELNNCDEIDSVGESVAICFTGVNDSRCPINANCVWQGVAVAKFTFKNGTADHQLTLATTKFPGFPSTDTVVSGYRIRLVNVTPYPGTATPEPTRAILEVTR